MSRPRPQGQAYRIHQHYRKRIDKMANDILNLRMQADYWQDRYRTLEAATIKCPVCDTITELVGGKDGDTDLL